MNEQTTAVVACPHGGRIPADLTAKIRIQASDDGWAAVIWAERQQAHDRAAEVLARARQRAEEIEVKAKRGARQLQRKALDQGRQAGQRELAERLGALLRWRSHLAEEALDQLVDLASDMARRILRAELELDPGRIKAICEGVIRENRAGRSLSVRVHPADLDRLASADWRELQAECECRLSWQADPDVERGGCVLCGELGRVDARLGVQLAQLQAALGIREEG
ncbi:MAG: hypothetical protein JXR96_01255 [Deltaproteobacteria bacterium]|nr:hypothetical protein [Deltaproteobacteria bacterium]